MVNPTTPPANGFVKQARKVYNPMGFAKGYNFILWFIFGGAMVGFTLARFEYLDFNKRFCVTGGASPGECYWYTKEQRYKVGIIMHLAGVVPGGFLAIFQFIPAIRYRALLYHRMAGYVIFVLILAGNAGAVMITDQAFGGGLDTQVYVGFVALLTTIGLINAIYNIKRLQIDQHRAWMLRTWFYLGTIITTRLILIISISVLSVFPGRLYYLAQNCGKIAYMLNKSEASTKYPACVVNGTFSSDAYAAVQVDLNGEGVENVGAALNFGFGTALWLSLALHAIGVEIYLRFTPKEAQRLREVSYQRQLERGMKNPGSAGLVPEKFGDMDQWVPTEQGVKKTETGSSQHTHSIEQAREIEK